MRRVEIAMTDRLNNAEIIKDIVHGYKKGQTNIDEASLAIAECTNLQEEIVKCFLKVMKRSNIIEHSFAGEKNDTSI